MSSIVASTIVSAPIDSVFEVYTDLSKAAERSPDTTDLELLTDGPGTSWRETRVMFGKKAVEEMWIKDFEPPNRYTVEASSHGMRYETLMEFTPEGEGTKVAWTFGSTPLTLVDGTLKRDP